MPYDIGIDVFGLSQVNDLENAFYQEVFKMLKKRGKNNDLIADQIPFNPLQPDELIYSLTHKHSFAIFKQPTTYSYLIKKAFN